MRFLTLFMLLIALPAAAQEAGSSLTSREQMSMITFQHCKESTLKDRISTGLLTQAGLSLNLLCDCVANNFTASLDEAEMQDIKAGAVLEDTLDRMSKYYFFCLKTQAETMGIKVKWPESMPELPAYLLPPDSQKNIQQKQKPSPAPADKAPKAPATKAE
jgi:hypothetical protein